MESFTSVVVTPDDSLLSSIVWISMSESSLLTSACSSRTSGAAGFHNCGFCVRQKRAINESIYLIGLGARQLCSRIGFRGCRIDETHQMIEVMEVSGKRFRVSAGRFQTGMNLTDMILLEPIR